MATSIRLQRAARLITVLLQNDSKFVVSKVPRGLYSRSQIRGLSHQIRTLTTQTETATDSDYHSIIKDSERATGGSSKHEFQAETRMLLDIVAKSLYSDKEVFVRELISNASDALEKLRYQNLTSGSPDSSVPLEIHIATDKMARTLTIQDTGIGMNREELLSNLGTIARSGSKAFLEKLKQSGNEPGQIIGQFGVGFYSCFMVADKVEVYTLSADPASSGLLWSSDGSGVFEIQEAEGVSRGTKIVIHLKLESREFSDEETIKGIIKKYSNFVGSPIYVNGKRANTIQPLWLVDSKDITPQMHDEFYRFIANSFDRPRFTLHYIADAPLSVRALLYFPEGKPGLFELSRDADVGVALYCRKVLIKSKADILPKWLRFVKGVVDSEDIPLNLSRELLQNSALIRKLQTVLTNRILRFLHDKSTKETNEFNLFYKDYGIFLKEGIVSNTEQIQKEEIAKLLRFESSQSQPGESVSLPQYCSRLKAAQRDIFYLAAPSRTLAESSPYLEALKQRDVEVLFCYEPYDELVLMQLRQFNSHNLTSVEKEMRQVKEPENLSDLGPDSLSRTSVDALLPWMKQVLVGKAYNIRITQQLDSHPCVITVEEMAAARHFVRTQSHQLPEDSRFSLLQPQLEVNPRHPIIKKLATLKDSNPRLAELLVKQLFSNAMVGAGLVEDPRTILTSINELLTLSLEKH